MRRILTRVLAASALAAVSVALVPARPAVAADAICYNCPPEWADWGGMLKAIKADLGIDVPQDNKNSGQSLTQIIAEKASPVADVAYLGVTFGIKAKDAGVTQPYEPKGFADIPAGLKDPDGNWFTIHSGTLGLFVNKDALGKTPVPACWADLLKSEYKGLVGYLDPTSAFVGYVGAVAVNGALGGTLDDFRPGIEYFRKLQANQPIVPKQTSYARVVSGEIPILFDYDFNAYRARYSDMGNFVFVIPCEGTVVVPYVMSMVKGAPHPEAAKKVLDYVLSDKGQGMWAKAYLRPARNIELPKDVASRFLPASDYARAKPVDYAKMEAAQKAFSEAYLNAVK
ncbi:ABC transporter substrate-binding protein [Xanthobacter dioxanivorans]|uniref:ABC transporter substrate-binding protein n=1 Tax=Xanthobacter dioxanivorans TaxID=2528964 RepID=A0A974PRK3_9HYPH|nr:ABC transporter substrate-binding protein [Xanthobacter dioxanivorans]QRG08089.1 ABC transporter substrate-binding protein [Xanthobacter dioxanivorans]